MRQGFAGVMLKQGNNLHNRSQNHPKWRKRCKKSRSSLKIILIILLNCWGMVHYECIPRGQEVTQELSVTVLQYLQEALQKAWLELWQKLSWFLHCDNTAMHMVMSIQKFLTKDRTPVVPQPSCNPDLFPGDFSSSWMWKLV
jgi:Transposase.